MGRISWLGRGEGGWEHDENGGDAWRNGKDLHRPVNMRSALPSSPATAFIAFKKDERAYESFLWMAALP